MVSDILRVVDSGDLALLTLQALSAAFDTVDHATLLRRLGESYGVGGVVHWWFTSYHGGHKQSVRCGGKRSTPKIVMCGSQIDLSSSDPLPALHG